MPRQITTIDWKMALGFGGMLLLIIAIGFIGIYQIQQLGHVVAQLAEVELPMQNAALQMKSSNIRYAMGLRSYVFLQQTSYPDLGLLKEKLDLIHSAAKAFDASLVFYTSHATETRMKEWIGTLQLYERDLRQRQESIISFAASKDKSEDAGKKFAGVLNQLMMSFEDRLDGIDSFLDDSITRFHSPKLARQLVWAEVGRRRSVIFLSFSLAIGLLLGIQTVYLIYRRSKKEKEHREFLWRKVITVEEEERNNLSLQIHDQMGQDLSAMKIFLGLLDKDVSFENKDQKEKISRTKAILDGLIDKTHNISELLRPPELDELGLVESVAGLIVKHKDMTGVNCNYLKPAQEVRLPAEDSLVLYRVVQEALTNIAKHSAAKNIEIILIQKNAGVSLTITDDGTGFDIKTYAQRPLRRKDDKVKLGLQGLRERIELLGGNLRVSSKPGQGTRLEVNLPTT